MIHAFYCDIYIGTFFLSNIKNNKFLFFCAICCCCCLSIIYILISTVHSEYKSMNERTSVRVFFFFCEILPILLIFLFKCILLVLLSIKKKCVCSTIHVITKYYCFYLTQSSARHIIVLFL